MGSHAYSQNISRSGGPFQEAAVRRDVDEFKRLATSDVNANTPNSAGHLPLHMFCSTLWMHDGFPLDEQGPRPAMEWLLQHTNEINMPDQDGITALQIASIMS
jgi:ankyrin repeat protein